MFKEAVKNIWSKINLLDIYRRHKMRIKLKNKDISFLCPNCIGGILFHDLKLKFLSPTINLMITQKDFVKLALRLDDYLKKKLVFFEHPEYSCPCARLGDITIHFTHYKTMEEAKTKWYERMKRIDKNNLFVFIEERDGLTKEEICELRKLNVKGLVVFTAHEYSNIPYTVYLSKYNRNGEVGNILKKSYITGQHEYESFFDFVSWFNCANGGDYNVSPFIRRK